MSSNAPPTLSPFGPFENRVFRKLWFVWLGANLCMWMNDVAAAWIMTTLTSAPLMVALVQSASTLPVLLFAVPSGALADILDRRRFLLFTQLWVAAVAFVLCLVTAAGALTAELLLFLTFANGLGLAMRWPTFAALIAELVPRAQLPVATALGGVAMNLSRIFGPLVAGGVLAAFGGIYVFALNAVLSIVSALAILFWRGERTTGSLPREGYLGAIRVGWQHVRESPRMRAVLGRVVAFSFSSIALIALLPLLAKGPYGGGAWTFSLLMAAMGGGAITAALLLPRVRQRLSREAVVGVGILLHAGATAGAALASEVYFALPALFVAGIGWLSVANALNVSAHYALPDWIRARGIAFYQMAMMGGSALGAACWGYLAGASSLTASLTAAASVAVIGWLATRRLPIEGEPEQGPITPAVWTAPAAAIPLDHHSGPVQVSVEYRIDPARAVDFCAVMRESRRIWLQNGIRSWALYRDVGDPGRFFEQFGDDSWGDYLRRNERITASHVALKQHKLSFHVADSPPVVTRCVAEPVVR